MDPLSAFARHAKPSRCGRCKLITPSATRYHPSFRGPSINLGMTFNDLKLSARGGCELCRIFLRSLLYECPSTRVEQMMGAADGEISVAISTNSIAIEFEGVFSPKSGRVYYHKTYALGGHIPARDSSEDISRHATDWRLVTSPSPNAGCRSALSLAARWLSECSQGHTCRQPGPSPVLPTRIIDVDTKLLPTVDIKLGLGEYGEYLALSYCWGIGPHNYGLKKSWKFPRGRRSIFYHRLPKTIKDAISITRQLGFRYLWVDALCIIQDDKDDWQRESARMSKVYGNAYCTISATGAEGVSEGCFMKRTALDIPAPPRRLFGDTGPILIPSTPRWSVSVLEGPLNSRLWALQERALSSRILHWTKHELAWECPQKRASETFPSGVQRRGGSGGEPGILLAFGTAMGRMRWKAEILGGWIRIAEEASRRKLTRDSDILPALAGLAKIVHGCTNDRYYAGHWSSDLSRSLCWHVKMGTATAPRPQSYRAPSWSWASVINEVEFPSAGVAKFEVLCAEVQLAGPDPFGQVKSGKIQVSGHISQPLTMHIVGSGEGRQGLLYSGGVKIQGKELGFVLLDALPPPEWNMEEIGGISCLQASTYRVHTGRGDYYHAIALLPITGEEDTYSRIGWTFFLDDMSAFCTKKIVTVV